MRAKDTMMDINQTREAIKNWESLPGRDDIYLDDYLTQRQAEISFKMGEKQGYHKGWEDAKKRGGYDETYSMER